MAASHESLLVFRKKRSAEAGLGDLIRLRGGTYRSQGRSEILPPAPKARKQHKENIKSVMYLASLRGNSQNNNQTIKLKFHRRVIETIILDIKQSFSLKVIKVD